MEVKINWLGHSSFLIEKDGYKIVVDPYKDNMIPGLKNLSLKAHLCLCSHEHDDHYGKENVIIEKTKIKNPFRITTLDSYHDHHQGSKRGKNLMTIFETKGLKIVHMGDQGCIPTNEQLARLRNADALMIPIGGFYTIDAKEAVEIIKLINPKVILPMHYRSEKFGFNELGTLEEFLSKCSEYPQNEAMSAIINMQSEKEVLILKIKET